jgi:putative transposase
MAAMFDMPPPGFVGLVPSKVVTIRRRHLPHWRQDGATYFATFRLADSLPPDRVRQLQQERDAWCKAHQDPDEGAWVEFQRRAFAKLDAWLHERHGSCCLADDGNCAHVSDAMRYFDGTRCLLGCMVVMSNHVHAVVRSAPNHKLESLIQSWKRFSATKINRALGRAGDSLWQAESFDRIVRDTKHLRRAVRYIEKNAISIGRPERFWIRDDWREWYQGPSCTTT